MDLATWRSVADSAIDELGLSTTPDQLINDITISNPEDTAILKVQARAGSPDDAVALAGAWVRGLQATIDQVDGDGTAGSAPMNVFLGDPAAAPTSAVYPDVRTALVIGGVLGLGFGLAFALIRTASDRRIRPGDAVGDKLGGGCQVNHCGRHSTAPGVRGEPVEFFTSSGAAKQRDGRTRLPVLAVCSPKGKASPGALGLALSTTFGRGTRNADPCHSR